MPFTQDLYLGHKNEEIICHEFIRRGLPVLRTTGKHDFDAYLNGCSIEVKLDLRSQATQFMAIEDKTIYRNPDFLIQTLCYAKVLTREQYQALYNTGKSVLMGDQLYEGRLIPKSYVHDLPFLDQFIKQL